MTLNEKNFKKLDMGMSGTIFESMTAAHSHEECELYLLTEGICTYLINDEMYTIRRGDLVVIPEHTLHRTIYDPQDVHERMLCSLSLELLPPELYSLILKKHYVYRFGYKFEEILKILKEIKTNYHLNDTYSTEAIKANVTMLFIMLLRENNDILVPARTDFFSSKVIDFIINNYDKDVSLESAARMFYVTPSQLLRTFKKETKFTFWEYMLLYRIEKAKEFLQTTNKSVKEISYMCGFKDSNYFSTCFKKHTGYTPKDFRNKN